MTLRQPCHLVFVALPWILALPLLLGDGVAAQQPQPMSVKQLEPTSLPRGKTTTVTLVAQGLPNIQSAFITPPIGAKVVEIKPGPSRTGGIGEVGIVIAVDATATPGERTLFVSSPGWEFELTKIRIQDHDLRIADLKFGLGEAQIPADHAPGLRRFSFTLYDDVGDVIRPDATLVGELNTTTKCGDKELSAGNNDLDIGVSGSGAAGKTAPSEAVPTQMVRTVKDPDKALGPPPEIPKALPLEKAVGVRGVNTTGTTVTFNLPSWTGTGACELRVWIKDKAGNESNVLRLAVDLK